MNLVPRPTVALALSALGLAVAQHGRFGVVTGHSMTPTLHHGEIVWVESINPTGPQVDRGDVVVFRCQGRTYVKRIYAIAGERVLLLAEVSDAEPAITPIRPDAEAQTMLALRRCPGRVRLQHLRVPAGSFYALGDALTNSIDSRTLGPIPLRAIVGRVHLLSGRLRYVDLAMGPLRPLHAIRHSRRGLLRVRTPRCAEDTPPRRRRGPGRPPR